MENSKEILEVLKSIDEKLGLIVIQQEEGQKDILLALDSIQTDIMTNNI